MSIVPLPLGELTHPARGWIQWRCPVAAASNRPMCEAGAKYPEDGHRSFSLLYAYSDTHLEPLDNDWRWMSISYFWRSWNHCDASAVVMHNARYQKTVAHHFIVIAWEISSLGPGRCNQEDGWERQRGYDGYLHQESGLFPLRRAKVRKTKKCPV